MTMTVTSDIKNKEKNLAELMVKILKEPLNPLESSIDDLKNTILDTKDSIQELHDTLDASILDNEKSSKSLNRLLRKIQDDDIKNITCTLQKYILEQHDIQNKNIKKLEQVVINEINLNRDINEKSTTNLAEKLEHTNKSITIELKNAVDKVYIFLAEQQRNSQEANNIFFEKLGSIFSAQLELKQSTENLFHEIIIANQAAHENQSMYTKKAIQEASSEIQGIITEHLFALENMTKSLGQNQTEIVKNLNQQHTELREKLKSNQIKLKHLTVTNIILFTSIVGYISYDIYLKFI